MQRRRAPHRRPRSLLRQGRKERSAPLTRHTVAVLRVWLAERGSDGPLFPTRRGGALSVESVGDLVDRNVADARHNCPTWSARRVTPHTLRNSSPRASTPRSSRDGSATSTPRPPRSHRLDTSASPPPIEQAREGSEDEFRRCAEDNEQDASHALPSAVIEPSEERCGRRPRVARLRLRRGLRDRNHAPSDVPQVPSAGRPLRLSRRI